MEQINLEDNQKELKAGGWKDGGGEYFFIISGKRWGNGVSFK